MKNTIKVLGIIALVAVIGFSMTACGGDSVPEPLPPDPTSAIFESKDAAGNIYLLVIESAASGNIRAAYDPKPNDPYTLTYIPKTGDIKKSSGKVQAAESTITLKPNTGTETFTITVTTSGDVKTMTAITVTGGGAETIPAAESMTPKKLKTYPEVKFIANRWENEVGAIGENWTNDTDLKYSDFTEAIPKNGDTIKFKIRGTTDKPLNWFGIGLSSYADGLGFKWFAGSLEHEGKFRFTRLLTSFDETIEIDFVFEGSEEAFVDDGKITQKAYENMYLDMSNYLWQQKADKTYAYNNASKLDVPTKTHMATMRNLTVQLVDITPKK